MTRPIKVPGYVLKGSKLEKIPGYGLDASRKIQQRKSKKTKVARRVVR